MQKIGYSLIDENNEEVLHWGSTLGQEVGIPNPIFLPNNMQVHGITEIGPIGDYRLVERWIDGDKSKAFLVSGETKAFDGEKIVLTWQYRLPNEQEYAEAIQKHIDTTAQSKDYENGVSLVSYNDSTNTKWASEAQTFIVWRDSVWAYAYNLMEQVKQGLAVQPTIEQLIAQLPQIVWPA